MAYLWIKSYVLSCKRAFKIGKRKLNVRTVRRLEKREELSQLSKASGLQILAIQEHRIFHDGPVQRTMIGVRRAT